MTTARCIVFIDRPDWHSRQLGAAFAGVDIIRDAAGRLLVLEVNSNPAWSALQRVTRRPIAEALVADFLSQAASLAEARADGAIRAR